MRHQKTITVSGQPLTILELTVADVRAMYAQQDDERTELPGIDPILSGLIVGIDSVSVEQLSDADAAMIAAEFRSVNTAFFSPKHRSQIPATAQELVDSLDDACLVLMTHGLSDVYQFGWALFMRAMDVFKA